jgi:DNA-binding NarL/FixJ family response regulator
MSIRILVAYDQKVISDGLASLLKRDQDIQLVGMVKSDQLNGQVVGQLNPHMVVVGHISNPHELLQIPMFETPAEGGAYPKDQVRFKSELGDREEQVLRLVAVGRTSKEIARNLDISPSTVDVHRRNIMRKLGLHKVADLTRFAIRHQIISI